jgi:CYTH domain-containing protein
MPILEIEKKFILKSLPQVKPSDVFEIDQFYYKNSNGVWERARTYHSATGGDKWIHTIKKSISKGVNLEEEKSFTQEEWKDFVKKCEDPLNLGRHIKKRRHIYPFMDLVWEVDEFLSGYSLIIAELELPTRRYKYDVPNFIKEVLLLEVTGLKQFSNRNLSLPLFPTSQP